VYRIICFKSFEGNDDGIDYNTLVEFEALDNDIRSGTSRFVRKFSKVRQSIVMRFTIGRTLYESHIVGVFTSFISTRQYFIITFHINRIRASQPPIDII